MKPKPLIPLKKAVPTERVRSVTRMVLDGTAPCEIITIAQVWREEKDDGPWTLSNMDLHREAKRFHPSYVREIARALVEMDRVSRVEVVCYFTGEGIEIERTDR